MEMTSAWQGCEGHRDSLLWRGAFGPRVCPQGDGEALATAGAPGRKAGAPATMGYTMAVASFSPGATVRPAQQPLRASLSTRDPASAFRAGTRKGTCPHGNEYGGSGLT